jgi:hypothetical protein
MFSVQQTPPHAALVSRPQARPDERAVYLMLTPQGQPAWTHDPATATAFSSMREATRMAMRLPANLRAFGLLRDVEVTLAKPH